MTSSDVRRPSGSRVLPETGTAVANARWASDVIAHGAAEVIASDTVVIASTTTITGSLTSARIGDVLWITSGALIKTQVSVIEVAGATLSLGQTLPSAPSGGVTYQILRYRPLVLDSSGAVTTAPSASVSTVKITDAGGSDIVDVIAIPTFAAGIDVATLKALLAYAQFGFKWDPAYVDTSSADGLSYSGVMNDRGDFMVGLGSIRNSNLNVGHGTATQYTTGTQQAGTQRVSQSGAATSTLSSVSASATTVALLAASNRRAGAIFTNESSSIAYVAFAATSSLTLYTVSINPFDRFVMPMPVFTGAISCIWGSATGAMRITELT